MVNINKSSKNEKAVSPVIVVIMTAAIIIILAALIAACAFEIPKILTTV